MSTSTSHLHIPAPADRSDSPFSNMQWRQLGSKTWMPFRFWNQNKTVKCTSPLTVAMSALDTWMQMHKIIHNAQNNLQGETRTTCLGWLRFEMGWGLRMQT